MNEPLKSTRICAVCGKEFIFHRGAGWLYKRVKGQKTIYFCSWKCQRLVELGKVKIVTKQEDSEVCITALGLLQSSFRQTMF